jgi:hypothetical protein
VTDTTAAPGAGIDPLYTAYAIKKLFAFIATHVKVRFTI